MPTSYFSQGGIEMTVQKSESAEFVQSPPSFRIREVTQGDIASRVDWDDGHVSEFHWVWLRDNCGCASCTHPETHERTVDILSWPEDIHPESLSLNDDGALEIIWSSGGHASRYTPGWLRAHCYSAHARAERRAAPILWDGGLGGELPVIQHTDIVAGDAGVVHWLHNLRDYGVALIRGVPCEKGQVKRLAGRIGPVRETNFGDIFDVVSMPKPNSNAYTALSLPLHTDLPFRELEPGYQFLHCLCNEATGGDSLLVDGFRIARALHDDDREAFDTLCRVRFNFGFWDDHVDYRLSAPVIALDDSGGIREIRFNQATAAPFDVPGEQMPLAYRAWRRFATFTLDRRYQMQLRLEAGDTISFDNRRVLHARTAFDPASGRRHLQGCYVEREDADCRLRMLQRSFSPSA